jgi:hypothetical protein
LLTALYVLKIVPLTKETPQICLDPQSRRGAVRRATLRRESANPTKPEAAWRTRALKKRPKRQENEKNP